MPREKTYGIIKPLPQIHVASQRVLIRWSPSCPNDNVLVHILCAGLLSCPTSPHSRCASRDHSTNKLLALKSLSQGWSLGEWKLRPTQGAPGWWPRWTKGQADSCTSVRRGESPQFNHGWLSSKSNYISQLKFQSIWWNVMNWPKSIWPFGHCDVLPVNVSSFWKSEVGRGYCSLALLPQPP